MTTQAAFLQRLGIVQRAEALAKARPDHADRIARQLHRLTAPGEMGALFKAAVIHHPDQPIPPGFG